MILLGSWWLWDSGSGGAAVDPVIHPPMALIWPHPPTGDTKHVVVFGLLQTPAPAGG